jgi:hypothetical protein
VAVVAIVAAVDRVGGSSLIVLLGAAPRGQKLRKPWPRTEPETSGSLLSLKHFFIPGTVNGEDEEEEKSEM